MQVNDYISIVSFLSEILAGNILAKRSIYDRKVLSAEGSRKSEKFKHLNGGFLYFL